jgi:hypothetical protein
VREVFFVSTRTDEHALEFYKFRADETIDLIIEKTLAS